MRKKLYIFEHFAKSKKWFFCQYLSFSVWFLLKFQKSIKLKPPTVPSPQSSRYRICWKNFGKWIWIENWKQINYDLWYWFESTHFLLRKKTSLRPFLDKLELVVRQKIAPDHFTGFFRTPKHNWSNHQKIVIRNNFD